MKWLLVIHRKKFEQQIPAVYQNYDEILTYHHHHLHGSASMPGRNRKKSTELKPNKQNGMNIHQYQHEEI